MMSTMASVDIRRSDARWRGRWRAYKVFIDGEEVGRLRRGETAQFDVGPGEHMVQVGVDWNRSTQLAVSGDGDAVMRFRCGPTRGSGIAIIDLFKLRGDGAWLFLEPDEA
jgi:hypothetical protein